MIISFHDQEKLPSKLKTFNAHIVLENHKIVQFNLKRKTKRAELNYLLGKDTRIGLRIERSESL